MDIDGAIADRWRPANVYACEANELDIHVHQVVHQAGLQLIEKLSAPLPPLRGVRCDDKAVWTQPGAKVNILVELSLVSGLKFVARFALTDHQISINDSQEVDFQPRFFFVLSVTAYFTVGGIEKGNLGTPAKVVQGQQRYVGVVDEDFGSDLVEAKVDYGLGSEDVLTAAAMAGYLVGKLSEGIPIRLAAVRALDD
jgi:hypothetical protein